MYHFVAHSVLDRWLFRDWEEAAALWVRLAALPEPRALVLMPDHVHALLRVPAVGAFLAALRDYARWRGRHRGVGGEPAWLPVEAPEILTSSKHFLRSVRYIHLNPCRDGLASDPLGWPFSTHRDAVGLALPGVVAPERDPAAFHARVSGDPSVRVEGTALPFGRAGLRGASSEQVLAAVSALTRTPMPALCRRGPARDLLVHALHALALLPQAEVARWTEVSRGTVLRTPEVPDAHVRLVERVLDDPRFAGLHTAPLERTPAWRAYRDQRVRRGVYELFARAARQRKARERAWARFREDLARRENVVRAVAGQRERRF
jgi:REP element-mobilizing transposase RayT